MLVADEIMNTEEVVKQSNIVIDYVKSMIPGCLGFIVNILIALVIYFVGVKVIALIRRTVGRIMDRSNLDEGVKQFLDSLLKFGLFFLLVVLIATRFGVTTASITALVGSAGLALGLAMQGSLANFAGGVLILILKPFEVGDYIITEAGQEGTVSQIQICYTRLLTVDNRLIVIPNGKLSDGVITNVTKMDKRRLDMTYSIAYGEDLKKAKEILEEILNTDISRIQEDEIQVFVDRLGDSEVVLGARLWVSTQEYWDAKWRLQEAILERFRQEKISIPFPQMEVTINK